MKKSVLKLMRIALMTCILIVCAQIAIPFAGVPMTLQTFAVALCGYILGAKNGLTAVFLYLMLGAIGLPVFTGMGASFGFLFGLTGGFLWGFFVLVFFCGISSHIKSSVKAYFLSLSGLFLCHVCGVFWFSFVSENYILSAFFLTSFPYLLKDIASVIFARILVIKLRQRYPQLLLFHHVT